MSNQLKFKAGDRIEPVQKGLESPADSHGFIIAIEFDELINVWSYKINWTKGIGGFGVFPCNVIDEFFTRIE